MPRSSPGKYEHRTVTGGIGHNLPQEAPREFAQAVVSTPRVNAVAPGVIKTPMHGPETHDFLAALHPVGRMGEVQDVVDAILYLEKAPFVTGSTLYVDGGQAAGHW
jgi:NAD(P)-dependent dehydrogenase (short-subunit alcohol dehydrogenase family)